MVDFHGDLPGEGLVRQGLDDLASGKETLPALLVSLGVTRLRRAGLPIPSPFPDADHRLYLALEREFGNDAHSRYNALLRTLVSFERALECAN